MAAKKDAPIGIEEWSYRKTLDPIELQPIYLDFRNEIVAPEKVAVITHYFLDKWAPQLGPTLTLLIIRLRRYCYFNRLTKERRDWCYPTQETLAREVGVSVDTIQRELKRPLAGYFVRRGARYIYNPVKKKKIRTSDTYYVVMDEPLTPEDEEGLKTKVEERSRHNEAEERRRESPKPQIAVQVRSTAEKASPKPQIAVQHSYRNLRQEDVLLRGTLRNVNVNADLSDPPKDPEPLEGEKEAQVQGVVREMLEVLGDPQSMKYYAFLARRILDAYQSPELIFRALSETKDEARMGRIRRSRAAFFVDLVKRYCAEDGVSLKRDTPAPP
jgi:hypothetical protein